MGQLLIFLSLLFSACRTGTQMLDAQQAHPTDGIYSLKHNKLLLHLTTDTTRSLQASEREIPKFLQRVLTNPIAFTVLDRNAGVAALGPPGSKPLIQVFFSDDFYFGSWAFGQKTAFSEDQADADCFYREDFMLQGKLLPASPRTRSPEEQLDAGAMELQLQWATHIWGHCSAALTKAAECYQDFELCKAKTELEKIQKQRQVESKYGGFLDLQLLNFQDFSQLRNYAYEIFYGP